MNELREEIRPEPAARAAVPAWPQGDARGPEPSRGGSRRRAQGAALAALALAVAGAVVGLRVRQAKAAALPRWETAKVDRGRVSARVTASGVLSAIVTVQVGSQVSGTIAALHADFNSTVRKGELLAKIDPRLFEAAVQQARANLAAARGNLAKAKAQAVDAERSARRSAELFAGSLVAQADAESARAAADAAKAAVDAAEGGVEQAKAQLHQAEVNLAYTDIRSPKDGTVISRNVDVGQTVAASLQAPTLFLVAEDLRKMQVDTSVAEADIGKLRPGMKATFTVDAWPGERFRGTVRQVRNAPQTVQNVVTYDAVIDVDNAGLKLKPGMTANCTFVWADEENVLRVPGAALRFRPPGEAVAAADGRNAGPRGAATEAGAGRAPGGGRRPGGGAGADPSRKTVWLLSGGAPRAVTVKTGVSDGTMVEVLEGGLKEGDLVVTDVAAGSPSPVAAAAPAAAGGLPRRLF